MFIIIYTLVACVAYLTTMSTNQPAADDSGFGGTSFLSTTGGGDTAAGSPSQSDTSAIGISVPKLIRAVNILTTRIETLESEIAKTKQDSVDAVKKLEVRLDSQNTKIYNLDTQATKNTADIVALSAEVASTVVDDENTPSGVLPPSSQSGSVGSMVCDSTLLEMPSSFSTDVLSDKFAKWQFPFPTQTGAYWIDYEVFLMDYMVTTNSVNVRTDMYESLRRSSRHFTPEAMRSMVSRFLEYMEECMAVYADDTHYYRSVGVVLAALHVGAKSRADLRQSLQMMCSGLNGICDRMLADVPPNVVVPPTFVANAAVVSKWYRMRLALVIGLSHEHCKLTTFKKTKGYVCDMIGVDGIARHALQVPLEFPSAALVDTRFVDFQCSSTVCTDSAALFSIEKLASLDEVLKESLKFPMVISGAEVDYRRVLFDLLLQMSVERVPLYHNMYTRLLLAVGRFHGKGSLSKAWAALVSKFVMKYVGLLVKTESRCATVSHYVARLSKCATMKEKVELLWRMCSGIDGAALDTPFESTTYPAHIKCINTHTVTMWYHLMVGFALGTEMRKGLVVIYSGSRKRAVDIHSIRSRLESLFILK